MIKRIRKLDFVEKTPVKKIRRPTRKELTEKSLKRHLKRVRKFASKKIVI